MSIDLSRRLYKSLKFFRKMYIQLLSSLFLDSYSIKSLERYVEKVENMSAKMEAEKKAVIGEDGRGSDSDDDDYDAGFPCDDDHDGDDTPTVGSLKERVWYRVMGIREVAMGEGRESNMMVFLERRGGKTQVWVTSIIARAIQFKWNAKAEDENLFFLSKGLRKSKKTVHEYYDFSLRVLKKVVLENGKVMRNSNEYDENNVDEDDQGSSAKKRRRSSAK